MIEAELVLVLDDILLPVKVYRISPELVSRIARESEESRIERDQLTKQAQRPSKRFKCGRLVLGKRKSQGRGTSVAASSL